MIVLISIHLSVWKNGNSLSSLQCYLILQQLPLSDQITELILAGHRPPK